MPHITIDKSVVAGKIKPMHCVNFGPYVPKVEVARGNFEIFKALKVPYARNHDASLIYHHGLNHIVDVNNIFTDFSRDPDDPSAYDFVLTDEYVANSFAVGAEMFYRLGSHVEKWSKRYDTLPPADFNKWARICEHIIRHYNEGWASGFHYNLKYWEIWCEPDLSNHYAWTGTAEEYYDLYEIAYKHLKGCFPELKIGGPSLAHDEAWAARFLTEMRKRDVGIDFFSWHAYVKTPERILEKARVFRDLLDANGYQNTENILNEYNYCRGWLNKDMDYTYQQVSSNKGAAFVAAAMCAAQNSTIDMLMYYSANPGVWCCLWDMQTLRPLKGYYAMLWFSELYQAGAQVECINEEKELYAVAAIDDAGDVKLLLANYSDDETHDEIREVEVTFKGCEKLVMRKFVVDADTTASECAIKLDRNGSTKILMKPNSFVFLSE